MRKILLIALLFLGILANAQSPDGVKYCKAYFTYSFNTSVDSFAPSAAINFFGFSDVPAVSWKWDFGDGTTSDEQNPLHIFTYPVRPYGNFMKVNPYRTVTLTTMTADSCSSTYSENIDIYDVPNPNTKTCKSDFYFYQTGYDSVAKSATFKFMNMSGAENATYLWNFSDGITSTEAEPEMTFDLSRTERKVCLTVYGTDSCSDELCQAVYIDPKGWGTKPDDSTATNCFTAFGYTVNYDIKTFAPALVLDFYAKSDPQVAKCLWNFGDGTYSEELNPTHIFNLPIGDDSITAEYNRYRTVCLTVTTESGCESSWCQTIDTYMNTNPVEVCDASFKYYSPESFVYVPNVTTYKFFATADNIISWEWQFEDGTVSYEPEPVMTFDNTKQTQKVCLTILTRDSCRSTWCETLYFNVTPVDTIYSESPCGYSFRFKSDYPVWASACVGTVTAEVVKGDSLIPTDYYYWTTPSGEYVDGQTLKNLCPTGWYTVTARTTDGCKFSASFIFNSDGTVTEVPINWWVEGWGDDSYIDYEVPDSSYTVEWIGCDGTVYTNETVAINQINCGSEKPNLILKDGAGNIIYTEKVALRTDVPQLPNNKKLMIYPNPVKNILNVRFANITDPDALFEITDIAGKVIQKNQLGNLKSGIQRGIDVSALGRGVYLGKVVSGNKVIASEKFTK